MSADARETIFGHRKRRYRNVEIAGVGALRIQSLTERERTKLDGGDKLRSQLIASCVVDDEGNRVFTDADAEALLDLDAGVVIAISDEILKHLDTPTIEETAKN